MNGGGDTLFLLTKEVNYKNNKPIEEYDSLLSHQNPKKIRKRKC